MKTRSAAADPKKRKQYLENESPLCKEILMSKPQASEYSSQTYSDLDTPTASASIADSESSRSYQKIELTPQATELRKNFYEFQKAVMDLEPYAESFLQVCSPHDLLDYFEPILFKLAKNPKQVRKNWSETETLLLINIVIYYCLLKGEEGHSLSDEAYRYIASIFPGKREDQIKLRWQGILKVTLSKAPWTKEEDDILTTIVQEKGPHRWKHVALELATRSGSGFLRQGKQCRERWINHLDPTLRKGGWDENEDLKLLNLLIELGKKWAEIAKRLGGRTENNVKNRWISLLRRYKAELENDPPSKKLDAENDCIEKSFARAILRAKKSEPANTKIKIQNAGDSKKNTKLKIEEDDSFEEESPDLSSNSDNVRYSNAKSAASSPVKRKVLRTSKRIAENLSKNLEREELTVNSAKLSQKKRSRARLQLPSKAQKSLEVSDSQERPPLLKLSKCSNAQEEETKAIHTVPEDSKSFDQLTEQFKQLHGFEIPKATTMGIEYDNDFISYANDDHEIGFKMPSLSRRSSSVLFSDPSDGNPALNALTKGIAHPEYFPRKPGDPLFGDPMHHRRDSLGDVGKGFNELDFFSPSISTEFAPTLESLDNPASKMLLKPSIMRRRMSSEHYPPFQYPNQGYEANPNSYLFPPLITKKDSLFMIDEPAAQHFDESKHTFEVPDAVHTKNDVYMQNWPFKLSDSDHYNLGNLSFSRNASEYSQFLDRKY